MNGTTYRFARKRDEHDFAGAVSCLDAAVVGVAAAAAEALYQANVVFGLHATLLCGFLGRCPRSRAVVPGKYIKRVRLYMNEDPEFVGDGIDGQALRKADWVDLVSDVADDSVTKPDERTLLMRQCWKALLNMPQLGWFEFRIMPSRVTAYANDFRLCDLRDILPTHFRLLRKHVRTAVTLRTWEDYEEPVDEFGRWVDELEDCVADDDGLYESRLVLDDCIPDNWLKPPDLEPALAKQSWASGDFWTIRASFQYHALRNYDAMQDLLARMYADKGMSMVSSSDSGMVR